MASAKSGDTVQVHYTGKLDDGTVFDSSSEREPIEFTLGEGRVIAGFENALIGMEPGASKTFTVEADDAYGQHNAEMVHEIERAKIPAEIELSVGTPLRATGPNGEEVVLTVVGLSDATVTVDTNHPLAGKDLTFEVTLVAIE